MDKRLREILDRDLFIMSLKNPLGGVDNPEISGQDEAISGIKTLFFEVIGESYKMGQREPNFIMGYNQAKAEIRKRLETL